MVAPREYFSVSTKLDTFCYRQCKLHRATCSRFDTIPACDRQTDRRTVGIAIASTALAIRALRRAVIGPIANWWCILNHLATSVVSSLKLRQTKHATVDSCDSGISVLNHRLSWSKFVNTHLYHSRQWFNIHEPDGRKQQLLSYSCARQPQHCHGQQTQGSLDVHGTPFLAQNRLLSSSSCQSEQIWWHYILIQNTNHRSTSLFWICYRLPLCTTELENPARFSCVYFIQFQSPVF